MKKVINNKKKSVNKAIPIILITFGVVLLISVLIIFFGGKKSNNDENHIPDPNDPSYGAVELPFDKKDVMTLIYQAKEIENDKDKWSVSYDALIAHTDDNDMYLIRYKKMYNDGMIEEYESIVTVNGEEKHVDLPGWPVDSKNLNEYSFIYYDENSVGYDPENQKYSTDLE